MSEMTQRMKWLLAKDPMFFTEVTWDFGMLLGIKARFPYNSPLRNDILEIEYLAGIKAPIDLELEMRRAIMKYFYGGND